MATIPFLSVTNTKPSNSKSGSVPFLSANGTKKPVVVTPETTYDQVKEVRKPDEEKQKTSIFGKNSFLFGKKEDPVVDSIKKQMDTDVGQMGLFYDRMKKAELEGDKKTAETYKKLLQGTQKKALENYDPVKIATAQSDKDLLRDAAYFDSVRSEDGALGNKTAKDVLKKNLVQDPLSVTPIGQQFSFLAKAVRVKKIANKLEDDEDVSPSELLFLRNYIDESSQGGSVGAGVTSLLLQAPAFMIEFMLSGGVSAGAKTGTKKLVTETIEKSIQKLATKEGKDLVNNKLLQYGTKFVGGTSGVIADIATRTATVRSPQIIADAITKTVPDLELSQDEKRGLVPVLSPDGKTGDTVLNATMKSIVENSIEIGSELAGKYIRLPEPVKAIAGKSAILKAFVEANKKFGEKKAVQAFKKIVDKTGFDGFFEENLEEFIAKVTNAGFAEIGLSDQPWKSPTKEEIAIQLLGIGILGTGFKGAEIALSQLDKRSEKAQKKEFASVIDTKIDLGEIPTTGGVDAVAAQMAQEMMPISDGNYNALKDKITEIINNDDALVEKINKAQEDIAVKNMSESINIFSKYQEETSDIDVEGSQVQAKVEEKDGAFSPVLTVSKNGNVEKTITFDQTFATQEEALASVDFAVNEDTPEGELVFKRKKSDPLKFDQKQSKVVDQIKSVQSDIANSQMSKEDGDVELEKLYKDLSRTLTLEQRDIIGQDTVDEFIKKLDNESYGNNTKKGQEINRSGRTGEGSQGAIERDKRTLRGAGQFGGLDNRIFRIQKQEDSRGRDRLRQDGEQESLSNFLNSKISQESTDTLLGYFANKTFPDVDILIQFDDELYGTSEFLAAVEWDIRGIVITLNPAFASEITPDVIDHEMAHIWTYTQTNTVRQSMFDAIKKEYYRNKSLFNRFQAEEKSLYWEDTVDQVYKQILKLNTISKDKAQNILKSVGLLDADGEVIIPDNVIEAGLNWKDTYGNALESALAFNGLNIPETILEGNTVMAQEMISHIAENNGNILLTQPELVAFVDQIQNETLGFGQTNTILDKTVSSISLNDALIGAKSLPIEPTMLPIAREIPNYESYSEFKNDLLFHGSIEEIDGELRPGGYDQVFWTALNPSVAQSYIPATGGATYYSVGGKSDYELKKDILPDSSFNKAALRLLGFDEKQISIDRVENNGRITSWSVKEGVDIPTYKDLDEKLREMGYTEKDDKIKNIFIDGVYTILPKNYKKPGTLFVFTGKTKLNFYDMRDEGGDDLGQYNETDRFKQLQDEGYDGVIINDILQSEQYGNVGHTSYGLFGSAISKLNKGSVTATNFDFDTDKGINEQNTPEFDSKKFYDLVKENEKLTQEGAVFKRGASEDVEVTTTILNDLQGKTTVSKQYILDATKRDAIKDVERDLILQALESEGDKVNVADFTKKVQAELLPVTAKKSYTAGNDLNEEEAIRAIESGKEVYGMEELMGDIVQSEEPLTIDDIENGDRIYEGYVLSEDKDGFTPRYENISLPADQRGEVENYFENIYETPIKTSAGGTHFGRDTENYFGHTRIEDMADGETRRVIEVQSDLFQKGNMEKEGGHWTFLNPGENFNQYAERTGKTMAEVSEMRDKELLKLKQYSNPTAHFRMVREEIKKAAENGKTKLLFPTGETAMKIEGLGQAENVWFFTDDIGGMTRGSLKPNTELKVGESIKQGRFGEDWIITDVLGDGKFKAVQKDVLTDSVYFENGTGAKIERDYSNIQEALDKLPQSYKEEFDISGKIDTNNPIYRFYEKDLGKYLKSKYNAKPVTDEQGVTWYEVEMFDKYADEPVVAFKRRKIDPSVDTDMVYTVDEEMPVIRDVPEELENQRIYLDLSKEAITGNPLFGLLKYVALSGEFEGKLPEVSGKKPADLINSKAYGKIKNADVLDFIQRGDTIISEYGFSDVEDVRADMEYFIESIKKYKQLQKEYRSNLRQFKNEQKDARAIDSFMSKLAKENQKIIEQSEKDAKFAQRIYDKGFKKGVTEGKKIGSFEARMNAKIVVETMKARAKVKEYNLIAEKKYEGNVRQQALSMVRDLIPTEERFKYLTRIAQMRNDAQLLELFEDVQTRKAELDIIKSITREKSRRRSTLAFLKKLHDLDNALVKDVKKMLDINIPIYDASIEQLDEMITEIKKRIYYRIDNNLTPYTRSEKISRQEAKAIAQNVKKATNKKALLEMISSGLSKMFDPMSRRLDVINPAITERIRDVFFNMDARNSKYTPVIEQFAKKANELKKISKEAYTQIDLFLLNGQFDEVVAVAKENGVDISKELTAVRNMLDQVFNEMREAGIDVEYKGGYWPRIFKMMNARMLQDFVKAAESKLGRPLTQEETAEIGNKMLRGFQIKNILLPTQRFEKERAVDVVDGNLYPYYEDSLESLRDHVILANRTIETRKFFGKFAENIKDLNQPIDQSIGFYVQNLVTEGKITNDQQKELRDILVTIFGQYRGSQFVSNVIYPIALGQPGSIITQLSDIAFSIIKNDVFEGAINTWGPMNITAQDVYQGENYANVEGDISPSKFAEVVLKPFSEVDKKMLQIFINGTYRRIVANAKKENPKLKKQLEYIFGEQKANEVMRELQNKTGNENGADLSEEIKRVIYTEISSVRPVSKVEKSETAIKYPLFYSLRNFGIKQLDFIRSNSIDIMRQGIKNGDRKMVIEGLSKLIAMSTILLAVGVGTDELKNLIMKGEFKDLKDSVLDKALQLIMLNGYVVDVYSREGVYQAALETFAPAPFSLTLQTVDDIIKDVNDFDLRIIKRVPWVGGIIYNQFNPAKS